MRLNYVAQTTAGIATALCLLLSSSGAVAASSLNQIGAVELDEAGDTTIVRLLGTAAPVFTVFKLEQPARLAVDIAAAEFGDVPNLLAGDTWAVGQILTAQYHADGTATARVVVSLKRPAQYTVRADGTALVIAVTADEPKARPTEATHGEPEPVMPAPPRSIDDIRFVDRAHAATVEIDVADGVQVVREPGEGTTALVLRGALLPKMLARSLDTRAFSGPVLGVTSFATGDGTDAVRIEAVLAAPVADRLVRDNDRLVWEFPKKATQLTRVAPPRAKAASAEQAFAAPRVAAAKASASRSRGMTFSGRRIDLDFKDADIHNILRLISDVGDVNIVTSDAVGGRVTIRMKNVPWDHALDVILRAKGLGMVMEGNLLRVAPRSDLEQEREAEIARQKQMMMLRPLETRLIPLSYAEASQTLNKLQYLLSPRGKLTFDQRTNTVIARDIDSSLDLVEEMVRNLDTQTPQVQIEARIIEARTNYSKQFGIQWGAAYEASPATGNPTGLVFPYQFGVGGGVTSTGTSTDGILLGQGANPNFVVNMPAPAGANSGGAMGFTFGSVNGAFNLNVRLSAAESTGDIRVLSAPKITTLDNVQANIEQGVQIPFSQISQDGVQTTFVDAKLSLNVTPHVTADGSVIMKVEVTRNEPDFANTGALGNPTILKKQAKTEMLIDDGDTAVIGGIYTTRDGRSWQKVPWFAEIPILGWLFKTRSDISDREEVLVFITPRIINRAQSIGH